MSNPIPLLDPMLQNSRMSLYAVVGENLMLYQELEWTLKGFLPLIDLHGAKHSFEHLPSRQKRLRGLTLGTLASRLLALSKDSSPEFARLITKVNKDRNDLAHHFFRKHKVAFTSIGSCNAAIAILADRRLDLRLLTRSLHDMLIASLHVLTETTFADTPEYARMRQLVDRMNTELRDGAELEWEHAVTWGEQGETLTAGPFKVGLKDRHSNGNPEAESMAESKEGKRRA